MKWKGKMKAKKISIQLQSEWTDQPALIKCLQFYFKLRFLQLGTVLGTVPGNVERQPKLCVSQGPLQKVARVFVAPNLGHCAPSAHKATSMGEGALLGLHRKSSVATAREGRKELPVQPPAPLGTRYFPKENASLRSSCAFTVNSWFMVHLRERTEQKDRNREREGQMTWAKKKHSTQPQIIIHSL